ncbi:MAG: HPF/RaiA family ribosome-associated protein [Thermoanaerobaculia bacterium]|nr:HPF/RaiA family ribosome-associated protein [Thermoanaerobaculia bacterium]
MNIEYTTKHFDLGDGMREFVEGKLVKVVKFVEEPVEIRVTLTPRRTATSPSCTSPTATGSHKLPRKRRRCTTRSTPRSRRSRNRRAGCAKSWSTSAAGRSGTAPKTNTGRSTSSIAAVSARRADIGWSRPRGCRSSR